MRFYFHLNYLHDFIADPEGGQHPDLQSAKAEAVQGIRELAAECLRTGEEFRLWSVRICDEAGDTLDEVYVKDALAGVIPPAVIPSEVKTGDSFGQAALRSGHEQ